MLNTLKLLLSIVFILYAGVISAQSIRISGFVKNAQTGDPLIGASIIAKASQKGAITDTKGHFSIQVEKNAVLHISQIGFTAKNITVSSPASNLIIKLKKSTTALDEFVVTALNISKEKKSLGYAVQEIQAKDFNKAKEPNIVNSLSGRFSGVRVTNSQGGMGSSRIIIRGETSISGNNQPLFVIDGIPVNNAQNMGDQNVDDNPSFSRDFSNAIADLNPNDIASISVLKGPTASALYGSRAAGGVILIQTKSGENTNGLGVTVNSNTTISNVLLLPKYQNIFGQGLNGKFKFVDGKGGGINDAVDESWGPKMNGQLIPQFYSDGKPVPFVPHPDNVRNYFKTGYKLNNGLAIAGSGDNYNFRFSYDNMNQHGIIPNTSQQKNSFSINAGYEITPKLSLDVSANYIRRDAPNLPGGGGLRETSTMLQFVWFGRQVSTQKLYDFYKAGNPTNWNNLYYTNIYANAYHNTVSQTRNRLIGRINLKYKINDKLTATFQTGNDFYIDKREMKVAYGTRGLSFGFYGIDSYIINENNTSLRVNYEDHFGKNFSFNLMVGANDRTNTSKNNNQNVSRLAVPGIYNLGNTRVPVISNNYFSKLKTYSAYSSAQVGYKGFAYINLTARNDWSSSLPPDQQSYFYPSVNGSFIVSNAFHLTSNKISLIKLRGGWSEVGKATRAYQLRNTYSFAPLFDGNPLLFADPTDKNSHLKPEQTSSTEVGLVLGLFKNRIHLDASFYNMNSYNQILAVDVSPATGYEKKLINGGKINNKGIELTLGLTPIRKTDFSWNVLLNYSTNQSKVVRLTKDNSIKNYTLGSDGTVQVLAASGQPYGMLFGTAYLRNSEGEIIINSDGLPKNNPNKQYLGSYTPDWLGSITNKLSFHHFHLSFLVDASIGGAIYSSTNATGAYTGVLALTLQGRDAAHGGEKYYYPDNNPNNGTKALPSGATSCPNGETIHDDGMVFNGVYADGKENTTIIPAQSYYKAINNIDEVFTYDATYVKLRQVTIGYRFTAPFIKTIGLQSATVSLVGRNLWIIDKNEPNIDPETSLNTKNGGQGIEDLGLPSVRSFGININLKF